MAETATRREAAFHQAGHAVATHLSRFHVLVRPLRIDAYGSGEMTAGLSRSKLLAAAKIAEATARADPEVASGIALILCAGLASERIAASRDPTLRPDAARSIGDFAAARQELAAAGLSDDTEPHELGAAVLLAAHWAVVETVAKRLIGANELGPGEIADLMASVALESLGREPPRP